MDIILLVLHVILSIGIITLVLLQKGAGASAGASFGGGGGAGSVFGATGSANFLSKTTAIFAICFFINILVLAYLASNRDIKTDSVLDTLSAPVTETSIPAAEDVTPEIPPAVEDSGDVAPGEVTKEDSVLPPADDAPVQGDAATDIPPPADK